MFGLSVPDAGKHHEYIRPHGIYIYAWLYFYQLPNITRMADIM